MGIWIYPLLHLAIVLVCIYWARAKGHPVVLLGLLACVAGPIILLALPFVKAPAWRPAPVVVPPSAANASFSAAAGPLGGYVAPGPAPARPARESIYTPLILNGIGIGMLLLIALGAGNDEAFSAWLIGVPLLSLVNGVFFLRAFAKRANGPAFLHLVVAMGGLSLVMYVLAQIGHR